MCTSTLQQEPEGSHYYLHRTCGEGAGRHEILPEINKTATKVIQAKTLINHLETCAQLQARALGHRTQGGNPQV